MVAVFVLLDLSVAVQVIVDFPTPNVEPDIGVQVTSRPPSTASVAVGVVYVIFAPLVLVAKAVIGPGTLLNTGGVVSAEQPGMGVTPGHTGPLPLHFPGDWQVVVAGWQTTPAATNESTGHAAALPEQVSAMSHVPALARQV
jgi:hypothetical protein